MKYLITICLIALVSAKFQYEYIGHEDLIKEVNESDAQWVAGENQFTGMSHQDVKDQKLGLIQETGEFIAKLAKRSLIDELEMQSSDLPESFDSRVKWASCVHPIRDQEKCGSCWAFSASEVLSDRWCIATGGKTDEVFSPQEMISCSDFNMGCQGGRLSAAWNFMCHYGLVTDSCEDYTSGAGASGSCSWKKCTASGQTWAPKTATHAKKFSTVAAIKAEIYANGPIQTGFTVFSDFMSYKSGVYTHVTGSALGGHAVKIVGWGVTADAKKTPYWIVANSWNNKWGLDGYFWMGMNGKCNFETQGIAGQANVSGAQPSFMCYLPF